MGADGTVFHVEGEYVEVEPPRLLVHTWNSSYDTAKTVVRWELEPQTVNALHPSGPRKTGSGTLVRVTQSGFAGNFEISSISRRRMEACPRLAGEVR